MRRRAFVALAGTAALSGCAPGHPGQQKDDTIGFEAGDGSVVILKPADRKPAPELAGETLDGKRLTTRDLVGRPVVLNVWGSWCAPCRAEAPALVEVAGRRPDVAFVGINTRDLDKAPAQAFVRAFKLPYPSIYDPDGALLLTFGQLPPKAIPSTLVIDAQGRVAARMLGEVTASTLLGVLDDVRAGS